MIVYTVAVLLTVLLAFAYERRRDLWWLMPLAALPLALVAVARWNVGTDFRRTYLPMYRALEHLRGVGKPAAKEKVFVRWAKRKTFGKTPKRVRKHFCKLVHRSEPGYRALMEVSLRSGVGFFGVISFCALATAACVFFAIFRFSRWPSLAAFLYVASSNYFLSLNIMRQYVAVGIGLVALTFIVDRKLWHFLACVAVATLFHYSAIALLPCCILSRTEITPKRGLVLVASALALALVIAPVFVDIVEIAVALVLAVSSAVAPPVHRFLLGVGADHYASYFSSVLAKDGFEWIFFAINLCFLAIGAWYWDRVREGNRLFVLWYGMTVIGTIALAFSGCIPLMKRINYYYAAPQFLMLPEILLAEEDVRRRRILTGVAILAFLAETIVAVCLLNKNGVLPYRIGFWRGLGLR